VISMRGIFLFSPLVGLALGGCYTHTPIVAVAADDIGVVAAPLRRPKASHFQ